MTGRIFAGVRFQAWPLGRFPPAACLNFGLFASNSRCCTSLPKGSFDSRRIATLETFPSRNVLADQWALDEAEIPGGFGKYTDRNQRLLPGGDDQPHRFQRVRRTGCLHQLRRLVTPVPIIPVRLEGKVAGAEVASRKRKRSRLSVGCKKWRSFGESALP